MMASAQVVETSVNTNNSPSQDYTANPDDHSNQNTELMLCTQHIVPVIQVEFPPRHYQMTSLLTSKENLKKSFQNVDKFLSVGGKNSPLKQKRGGGGGRSQTSLTAVEYLYRIRCSGRFCHVK